MNIEGIVQGTQLKALHHQKTFEVEVVHDAKEGYFRIMQLKKRR